MIRFFLKMVFLLVIVLAAVFYHNTDSGREMERRIGESLEFRSLMERGKILVKKTVRFVLMEGLDDGLAPGQRDEEKKPAPAVKKQRHNGEEEIREDERKRIEQIIESGG